jgi:hypothetical protein
VGSARRELEDATPVGAESGNRDGDEKGLAWVYRDGRLIRAVPPEITPAPAVQAGPGLESDIPLPVLPPGVQSWKDRTQVCRCCAEDIPALLPHKEYCPLYVAPVVRVTGCPVCDTTDTPHFHDKHILYEAGRELF